MFHKAFKIIIEPFRLKFTQKAGGLDFMHGKKTIQQFKEECLKITYYILVRGQFLKLSWYI